MSDTVVNFRSKNRLNVSDDFRDKVTIPRFGAVAWDSNGMGFGHRYTESIDNFELVPAASVADGTSKLMLLSGTGTEIIARNTKGGVLLTTQATTPADGDICILAGIATTGHDVLLNSNSMPWFHAVVSTSALTTRLAVAGLSVEPDAVQPSSCSADAALFLADPDDDVTSGLTAAEMLNWVVVQTVAGVETYTATSVPIVADELVDLRIRFNADRKPLYYINGTLVHTGVAATDAQGLHSLVGVESTGAAQATLDVAFVSVSRAIY